jgi:hypothetical protein
MKALFFGLLMFAPLAHAGPFGGTSLSADGKRLTIKTARGNMAAPKTEAAQQGYSQPRVANDGRTVGWLALSPSCCTSYPLPLALVVMDARRKPVRFEESPPIWAWKFELGNSAVAYRQRTTHGSSTVTYKLVRIRDREVLEQYECFSEDASSPAAEVPGWVWSIAEECPVQPASR